MPVETRYEAFLSYSHADREIAQWLHRALETYRLPKKLIGRATSQGPVPARLRRIFKDREELSASGNLGAAIETALAASDALIVICSRAAAASRWVNEEIRNYKRQHGDARVLAVITDGEPFASNIVGRESDECFPQALRFAVDSNGLITDQPLEPIAADLREGKDGKRLGKLKLIAGLTGVTLDELVRREAQRRAQRLTAVAVSASCLAVVMTVLSVAAFRARNDARQQREQAEGLIEFMLVDLRKKLEPVGRLDVLDVVGEKALAHYDNQQGLDANSLGHRSRALHLIGEIRQLRGNLGEALTAFQRAADTTAQLLKQAPNDEQRIFDHAQSVFWVGNIARDRGQRKDAENAFLQYRDLSKKLVLLNGTKREWQLEAAYSAMNVGIVTIEDSRPVDALKYLEETRDILARLVDAQPELAADLANTYGWMSRAYERAGRFDMAIEVQSAKQNLFLRAPDAKKNMQVKRGLQNASKELAHLFLAVGQLPLAKQHVSSSVQMAAELVASDPSNLFWLSEYCFAQLALVEVEILQNEISAAYQRLPLIRKNVSRLIGSDRTHAERRIALKGGLLALEARTKRFDPSLLLAEMKEYVIELTRLQNDRIKMQPGQLLFAASAEFELARLLAGLGREDEASLHFKHVGELIARNQIDADYALLTLLARSQFALREVEAASAFVKRIEASQYRHPVFAAFVIEMSREKGLGASKKKGSTS